MFICDFYSRSTAVLISVLKTFSFTLSLSPNSKGSRSNILSHKYLKKEKIHINPKRTVSILETFCLMCTSDVKDSFFKVFKYRYGYLFIEVFINIFLNTSKKSIPLQIHIR